MIGKEIRMERIINRATRKTVMIPMDHGVTIGPVKGLTDMGRTVDLVAIGGANAVIGHVGLALHGHRRYGRDIGLILHLSASTCLGPDPNNKVLVNSVERAIKVLRTKEPFDTKLFEAIMNRLDGKPKESLSIDGGLSIERTTGEMSDEDLIKETIAATLRAVKDGAAPSRDRLIASFHEEAQALTTAPRKNMKMLRSLQQKYLDQDDTITLDELNISPPTPDWRGHRLGDGPPKSR